ncbi:MAG: hypothetical protein VYE40_04340 [Myxococcota bacterium]|jgi:hypothetical protein|nr:hypothetical protein [Myxococcota bacterium]
MKHAALIAIATLVSLTSFVSPSDAQTKLTAKDLYFSRTTSSVKVLAKTPGELHYIGDLTLEKKVVSVYCGVSGKKLGCLLRNGTKTIGYSGTKKFDNPLVGFENPLVGFDNPLVGFENPLVGYVEFPGADGFLPMSVAEIKALKPSKAILTADNNAWKKVAPIRNWDKAKTFSPTDAQRANVLETLD